MSKWIFTQNHQNLEMKRIKTEHSRIETFWSSVRRMEDIAHQCSLLILIENTMACKKCICTNDNLQTKIWRNQQIYALCWAFRFDQSQKQENSGNIRHTETCQLSGSFNAREYEQMLGMGWLKRNFSSEIIFEQSFIFVLECMSDVSQ